MSTLELSFIITKESMNFLIFFQIPFQANCTLKLYNAPWNSSPLQDESLPFSDLMKMKEIIHPRLPPIPQG